MWPKIKVSHLNLAAPFSNTRAVQLSENSGFKGFVFFDAGSVILDLDWDKYFAAIGTYLIKPLVPDNFCAAFAKTGVMRKWSVGELGAYQYYQSVKSFLSSQGTKHSLQELTPQRLKEISSYVVGPMRPEVLALVSELKKNGFATGLLSNANVWHESDMERQTPLQSHFDVVIFSQDVGCEKPEPKIYETATLAAQSFCLEKKNRHLEAKDIYFVDDLPPNVIEAKRHGWNAALVLTITESLLERAKTGQVTDADLQVLSSKRENLIFGEQAARRVRDIFKELI